MKHILVLGAGKSSSVLIKYLLEQSAAYDWKVVVGDISKELAASKVGNHPNGEAIFFDVNDAEQRKKVIKQAMVVVSLLPTTSDALLSSSDLHILVAQECIRFKKHLVTASYVSPGMKALDKDAQKAGILLMCEMGLDPGIDHMTAMQQINKIKGEGGQLTAFKSYTGGLIASESDDNPWHYKFTWNPRNVVLAGQGTAVYKKDREYKYIPYNRLFKQIEDIHIDSYGKFEAYPNRDSLPYIAIYGLNDVPTVLRATLRRKGFCASWDAFVQLGWTDDTYLIKDADKLTYNDLLKAFLPTGSQPLKERLANFLHIDLHSEVIKNLEWLGLFDNIKIELNQGTPAQILQNLLEEKWKMKETDKDMVVMQHIFEYKLENKSKQTKFSMVVIGKDQTETAMAKTVGLPLGILVKLLLNDQIKLTGVQIPIMPEIYEPVIEELEQYLDFKF